MPGTTSRNPLKPQQIHLSDVLPFRILFWCWDWVPGIIILRSKVIVYYFSQNYHTFQCSTSFLLFLFVKMYFYFFSLKLYFIYSWQLSIKNASFNFFGHRIDLSASRYTYVSFHFSASPEWKKKILVKISSS